MMDDMEKTRVMKELTRLLQNSSGEVESEGELDERVEAGFEMHQSLAQICRTQSQPAKRVEKMLEQQFAPYKNEVERLDAQKISAIIEGSTENTLTNVPIPALIWFAVRNGGQDKELETRICCIGMVIYFILLIYTIFLSRFMIPSLFFS